MTRDTGEEELARLSKNELLEILQAEWTKHDQVPSISISSVSAHPILTD